MLIQVVKKYLYLSKDNRVPKICCGFDESHGTVYPNIDSDDRVYLYCLACDYKNYIGLEHYQLMEELVQYSS